MNNKPLLIIKNIIHEGPGLLEPILLERGIKYEILDLDQKTNFPNINHFSAFVVLGGPDSANDKNEKILKELQFVREIINAQNPYLGICLGLQLLVKACGGNVIKNPIKEIGFLDPENNPFSINLTKSGKEDPLFVGLDNSFSVFHLHGETVELTNEMELLGYGKFCKNQIVKVENNAYGIQCHFELTEKMLNLLINQDAELKLLNKDKLINTFNQIRKEYVLVGRKLFNNFLDIAGFSITTSY